MKASIIFLLGLTLFSCNSVKPVDPKRVEMYESVSEKYKQYVSLSTVCLGNEYADIHLKDSIINDSIIEMLKNDLYNEETKIGWKTFKIYDMNGNLVSDNGIKR